MNLKGVPILLYVLFVASSICRPTPAWADEDNDIAAAQACLDTIRPENHKQALGCVAGMEKYSDGNANPLKCGGHLLDGGLDWLQFPWIADDTVEYPLVLALNHVSDLDVDKDFARKTQARMPQHLQDYVYANV